MAVTVGSGEIVGGFRLSMSTRPRSRLDARPLLLAAIALLLGPNPLLSQATAQLQGTVRERGRDVVASASVALYQPGTEAPVRGTLTDDRGTFLLAGVQAGEYEIRVTRIGYLPSVRTVTLGDGVRQLDFLLDPSAVEVQGVSVEGERSRERVRFEESAGVSVQELSGAQLRRIPGVAEMDPLRAMAVLPGVVSTSDFASSFNVRGGSADQNLILLDGIPIYNPFHLGGFFSVFNGDMVARAELQTGGFPANQGGRVSSVLSVETDAGPGRFEVDAGISLLATRIAVSGGAPQGLEDALGLESVRWRGSARRSYLDVVLRPVFDLPYALSDYQGIVEMWTPGGSRIQLTGYTGSDVLNLTNFDPDDFPLRILWDWGNDLAGIRYTRIRPGGGSLDLRAGYTRFDTGLSFPDFDDTEFRSRIDQITLRADLETRPWRNWAVSLGGAADELSYDNLLATGGTEFGGGSGSGWLWGGYLHTAWKPGPWLLELGARVDAWAPRGEDPVVVPAPRLAMKRFFGRERDWAAKLAVGRYSQFLHSIRDEELPLGLDIWVLSGERVPHAVSDQIQGGVEGFFGNNWSLSLEGYHRWFDGVVATNPADDPNDPLDDLLRGTGTSYGADMMLRRVGEGVTGWLSLSWLKADRTFEDPFSGVLPPPTLTYAPIFDRRVDMDLVLQFPLPWGMEGGGRFTYGTGLPFTRPRAAFNLYGPRFSSQGRLTWPGDVPADEDAPLGIVLAPRNSERFPAYHRMDVSVRKTFNPGWGSITPYLDVVNVYNQRNVLFYFYQYETPPYTRSGVSMFPILPTFGFEVSF